MTNMLSSIAPKSNQLNADDLFGGRTMTIKITKVSGVSGEQLIAINFEGDNGKPYMPCKSMRRVLVHVWGIEGASYVGKSLTLYCDPKVLFGGVAVGGLRISHMSHIDKEITMALTASKSNRKPYTVNPLILDAGLDQLKEDARQASMQGTEVLKTFWDKLEKGQQKVLVGMMESLKTAAAEADKAKPENII